MRVLVRAPNAVGDAVLSLPAVRALAAALPPSAVTLAARPRVLPLFELAGTGARVLALPGGGPLSELRSASARAAEGFEVGVTFAPSFQAALFLRLSRCAARVGFESDGRGFLLTRSLGPGPDRRRHLSGSFADLAAAALDEAAVKPVGPGSRATALAVPPALASRCAEALPRSCRGRTFVLAPGAEYGPAKRWPEPRYVLLGRRLRQETALEPVVLGSAAEAALCARVADGCGGVSLAGREGIRFAAGILSQARLFVGNDSGLAHVSAAVGTPTVAVFGSTSPVWTAPAGARVAVVSRGVWCSPCFRRTCPYAYECLAGIGVDEVFRAAQAVLSRGRARP